MLFLINDCTCHFRNIFNLLCLLLIVIVLVILVISSNSHISILGYIMPYTVLQGYPICVLLFPLLVTQRLKANTYC